MEERWRCSYHPGGLWTPTQTGDRQAGRVRGGQAARTPHPLSSSPSLQVHPISETQARHMDPAAINTSRRPPPPLPRLTAAIRTKTPFLSSRLPLHLHIPPYFKSRAFIKVNSFKWISLFFFRVTERVQSQEAKIVPNCKSLTGMFGWKLYVQLMLCTDKDSVCACVRWIMFVQASIIGLGLRIARRSSMFIASVRAPDCLLGHRPLIRKLRQANAQTIKIIIPNGWQCYAGSLNH